MSTVNGYLGKAIAHAKKEAKRFASLGNKDAQRKHEQRAAWLEQLAEHDEIDFSESPVTSTPQEWLATVVTGALGNVKRIVIERDEDEDE
jgi:hypothetical protein